MNPSAGQPMNAPSQSQVIAAIHAALTAIETKLGANNSDVPTSHDFMIRELREDVTELQENPGGGIGDLDEDLEDIADLDSAVAGVIASDGSGWIHKTYAVLKTAMAFVKGDVGLGNLDNTSDVNKPVSSAQQAALDGKSNTGHSHVFALPVPCSAN